MEILIANDLKKSVLTVVHVIPNIKDYIAPTLNVIFNLQKDVGNLNMKETAVSNDGMWQSSLCINFQKTDLHTENYCTYTVIAVPNQKERSLPTFIIELKKGYTIGLKMDPGMTFMFSEKYLFHRQMILDMNSTNEHLFFNFASYGNVCLYNHMKTTIQRVYT